MEVDLFKYYNYRPILRKRIIIRSAHRIIIQVNITRHFSPNIITVRSKTVYKPIISPFFFRLLDRLVHRNNILYKVQFIISGDDKIYPKLCSKEHSHYLYVTVAFDHSALGSSVLIKILVALMSMHIKQLILYGYAFLKKQRCCLPYLDFS